MATQKLKDLMKLKDADQMTDYTAKMLKKLKEKAKSHGGKTEEGQEAWNEYEKE